MAKQTITTGNSANDGSGDPARTAFTKVNSNFTEIYQKFGDGSNLNNFVRQGGGVGQVDNMVYLGWSGSNLKAQVDSTDLGEVQTSVSNTILFGIGQSYISLTSSRALQTTYTNSTNKPIAISVILANVQSGTQVVWYVAEAAVAANTMQQNITQLAIYFIVPPGQAYRISSSSGSVGSWMELR